MAELNRLRVVEIARLTSKVGDGDKLESGLAAAIEVLSQASECHKIEMFRGIEDPDAFILSIAWTSVAAHHAWMTSDGQPRFVAHIAGLLAQAGNAHYRLCHELKSEHV